MLKWFLKRFRPSPSVDGIVRSFNKTVRKLEAVAADREQEATRQSEAVKKAQQAERDAQIESARAKSVAENLNKLVAVE